MKKFIVKKLKKIAIIFFILLIMLGAIQNYLSDSDNNNGYGIDVSSSYTSENACIDGMVYDNPNAPLYNKKTYSNHGGVTPEGYVKLAKQVRDYLRPVLREKGVEQYIDLLVSMCFNESQYGVTNKTNWLGSKGKHKAGIDSILGGVDAFVDNCLPATQKVKSKDIKVLLCCYNMGTLYPQFIANKGGDSKSNRDAFLKKYPSGVNNYPERILSFVKAQTPSDAGYGSGDDVSTDGDRDKLVAFAKKQIGKDYVYGTNGPKTFDCSGLMQYSYKKALGINLPRSSQAQYNGSTKINKNDVKKGDLVFFGGGKSSISHVAMCLGNDKMIEAPHTGAQVRIASISKHGKVVGYGRYIKESANSSSGSKSSVPLYSMGDKRWGSYVWKGPHGNTLARSGCGPTSIAMALKYWTNKDITPLTVGKWCTKRNSYHDTGGMSHALPAAISKYYNVQCKQLNSFDSAVSELKKGHTVLAACVAPGMFTDNGHIILLAKITKDGKIIVNDPNSKNYRKSILKSGFEHGFPQSTMRNQTHVWWSMYK